MHPEQVRSAQIRGSRRGVWVPWLLLAVLGSSPACGEAREFHIAPGGSNLNDGSSTHPWGSFDFAIDNLDPGDTLFVTGGTYHLSSRIQIRSNEGGTESSPIRIWALPGETPVLDFGGMSNTLWGSSSGRGIQIDGGANWLHLKGLTLQNARDNGIWSGANHGVFEQLVTRWNGDSGVQLSGFAAHNLILNTDSYENYDPSSNGENADGFALKFADVLNRVVVWENRVRGIDVNGNGFGVEVSNSTAYNSGRNWQFDETASETANPHILRNNISFAGSSSDTFLSGVTASFNTWNGIAVRESDFLSLDDTIARGPRNADGSLPRSDFLRLALGSNLIDAGTDVGLPFGGSATDLGAFETFASADFDEDGDVDADDFARWQSHFATTDAGPLEGDANRDGTVDGRDFLVWQREFLPGGSPAATIPTPEPHSLMLVSCVLCGAWRRTTCAGGYFMIPARCSRSSR